MIRLNVAKECPVFVRRFVTEATPLLAAKLGIADYDRTVNVKWGSIRPDRVLSHNSRGRVVEKTGGQFGPSVLGVFRAFRGRTRVTDFELLLAPDAPAETVRNFCHEFVHLKQWCLGELAIGPTGALSYQGREIPDVKAIPYNERPWEKEAFDKMDELANWVLGRLVQKLRSSKNDDNKLAA